MSDIELQGVMGGISYTPTLINAFVKGITSIYELGRRIGSAIYRYKYNNLCR